MKTTLCLFFAAALSPSVANALEWLGSDTSPGRAYSIAVSGNYAYVADINDGLLVIDVSNPEDPSLAGSVSAMNEARAVAVSGNYAYVADNGFGLRIVDVSDPTGPVLVGEYEIQTMTSTGTFDRSAYGVEVSGDYVYFAGLSNLLIVDVSNPSAPSLRGMLEDVGIRGTQGGRKLAVSGNHVYIHNDTNLMIVDVENPASPFLAGTYMGSIRIYDLAISGNFAFLADGNTLQILDISDPAQPDSVSSYNASAIIQAVTVFEDKAYISSSAIQVVDVGDPAAPALLETFTVPGGALNMEVTPDYLYTVNASALHVLGIGFLQLDVVGNIEFSGDALTLAVSGDYAYLSGERSGVGGNLWVVDTRDKTNPSLAGSLPPNLFGYTEALAAVDSYVYMAHFNALIVDVNDPADPVINLDGFNRTFNVRDMVVSGNFAYLVGDALEIFDVMDPLSPVPVEGGLILTPGANARSIALSGGRAYLAGDSGLAVYDVSNPAASTLMGTADAGSLIHIDVSGNYAFASSGGSTVLAFDVSDPASASPAGSYEMPWPIADMMLAGDILYIASGFSLISALDVSDPANIRLAHTYYTKGASQQLFIQGDYLYSADGWAGLSIISLADSITSSVGRDLFRGRDNLPSIQISSSPFDGGMQISWTGAGGSATSVGIYNPRGERVKFFPELKNPRVYWDASGSPPGIYFAKVQSGRQFETQPLVLRK